jgi:hypothetical protein
MGGEPTSPDTSQVKRACLDELDETQKALVEERAKLHHGLGVDITRSCVGSMPPHRRRCLRDACYQMGLSEPCCGRRDP